jgi:predicted nucleotidyltransferase
MHSSLSSHVSEVRDLCRRFGVARLEVFGSAARGVDFDPAGSDADFLVEFDPTADIAPLEQFFGLAQALELLLGRAVDLVERGAVRNPYVLAQINRARELVYAA